MLGFSSLIRAFSPIEIGFLEIDSHAKAHEEEGLSPQVEMLVYQILLYNLFYKNGYNNYGYVANSEFVQKLLDRELTVMIAKARERKMKMLFKKDVELH